MKSNLNRTLTAKFLSVLSIVVSAACVVVVVFLTLLLLGRENFNLEARGEAQSRLLAESVTFAMSQGVVDVAPFEDILRGADGIIEFRMIPIEGMTRQTHQSPDDVERRVLAEGELVAQFEQWGDDTRVFRVSEPIIANQSCLMCHPGIETGQAVAVASLFLSTADAERSIRQFVFGAVLVTIMAALSVLGIVALTLRIVVIKRISLLRTLMTDIVEGEGDLTRRVATSSDDEIGQVAIRIDQFIEQIHVIVSDMRTFAEENVHVSESLSTSASQTEQSAVDVKTTVDSMQKLMSEMNEQNTDAAASLSEIFASITSLTERIASQAASVSQASAAIEEMSSSIDNMAKIADQRLTSAHDLQQITQTGGEKMAQLRTLIESITSRVDSIGGMIDLINGVAAQTNLLSMNAAIEAAHAGEFGTGFAVVAEEIRRLAESTSENAKNVTSTLNHVIQEITESRDAAQESSTAFGRIDSEVTEVVDAFTEIANGTQELANGGREVLSASNSLLQITDEIRNGSIEIQKGTEQANAAQTAITDISEKSVRNIESIAARTSEISSAVSRIAEMAEEVNTLGRKLNEEVSQFKVE